MSCCCGSIKELIPIAGENAPGEIRLGVSASLEATYKRYFGWLFTVQKSIHMGAEGLKEKRYHAKAGDKAMSVQPCRSRDSGPCGTSIHPASVLYLVISAFCFFTLRY